MIILVPRARRESRNKRLEQFVGDIVEGVPQLCSVMRETLLENVLVNVQMESFPGEAKSTLRA